MKEHVDLEEQKRFSLAGEGPVKGREAAKWADPGRPRTTFKDFASSNRRCTHPRDPCLIGK